jgi:hypothetical protein
VYVTGGIRPYLAALVVLAFVAAALFEVIRGATWRERARLAAVRFGAIIVLWGAFAFGAGPYYPPYASIVVRTLGLEGAMEFSRALRAVEGARAGFVQSGGDTNIVKGEELEGAGVEAPAEPRQALARLLTGVAVIFIPIHAVQWTGAVSLSGGRGLLLVTDVDTIAVLGVTILAIVLMRRRRILAAARPYVAFCGVLGTVTILLMGYVVTNYGTLFRLRLFALMVLWMLPLAFCRSQDREGGEPSRDHGASVDTEPAAASELVRSN